MVCSVCLWFLSIARAAPTTSTNDVSLKSGLGVIQGHWEWHRPNDTRLHAWTEEPLPSTVDQHRWECLQTEGRRVPWLPSTKCLAELNWLPINPPLWVSLYLYYFRYIWRRRPWNLSYCYRDHSPCKFMRDLYFTEMYRSAATFSATDRTCLSSSFVSTQRAPEKLYVR